IRMPVDTRRQLIEEPRQAVVRRVTFGEVEVADRQPRRLVHAEGDRRRDAVTAILRVGAAGNATFGSHRIQPEGWATRDIILGHIDIGRDAACGIGAEVSTNVQESVGGGNLALLINDAARGAAPELHACRPFKHLHLVVVEAVAVVAAEITNAVEEYIVTRSKSADGQIVALRSALSRSNTYSWDV